MGSIILSGGKIVGSAGSIVTSSDQAWQFSDLITGFNPVTGQSFLTGTANWGIQDDGGTGNGATSSWQTDGTGGFYRLNYATLGTFGLRFTQTVTGLHQICVQYDVRRSNNLCSKQLKTYGWGQANGGATSNATFGCTMGGYAGTTYGVYYGDNISGSNDATVEYNASGYPTGSLPAIGYGSSFSRTPYPTQSNTVGATQDTTGTVWETYMVYFLGSSSGTNDGQITIWKLISGSWTMVMNMTAMWNCSTTTQDRGGFALGEFTSNSGFHEDYRNVYLMFSKPTNMGI